MALGRTLPESGIWNDFLRPHIERDFLKATVYDGCHGFDISHVMKNVSGTPSNFAGALRAKRPNTKLLHYIDGCILGSETNNTLKQVKNINYIRQIMIHWLQPDNGGLDNILAIPNVDENLYELVSKCKDMRANIRRRLTAPGAVATAELLPVHTLTGVLAGTVLNIGLSIMHEVANEYVGFKYVKYVMAPNYRIEGVVHVDSKGIFVYEIIGTRYHVAKSTAKALAYYFHDKGVANPRTGYKNIPIPYHWFVGKKNNKKVSLRDLCKDTHETYNVLYTHLFTEGNVRHNTRIEYISNDFKIIRGGDKVEKTRSWLDLTMFLFRPYWGTTPHRNTIDRCNYMKRALWSYFGVNDNNKMQICVNESIPVVDIFLFQLTTARLPRTTIPIKLINGTHQIFNDFTFTLPHPLIKAASWDDVLLLTNMFKIRGVAVLGALMNVLPNRGTAELLVPMFKLLPGLSLLCESDPLRSGGSDYNHVVKLFRRGLDIIISNAKQSMAGISNRYGTACSYTYSNPEVDETGIL